VISGLCYELDDICPLLGRYAAYSGNSLPTFQDNISAPHSVVKVKVKINLTLEQATKAERGSRGTALLFP